MSNVIDLSEVFRREQDASPPLVFFKRKTDPRFPNRTKFWFYSISKESVQNEIYYRLTEAESCGNGFGEFRGPFKKDNIWHATGFVVVYPDD